MAAAAAQAGACGRGWAGAAQALSPGSQTPGRGARFAGHAGVLVSWQAVMLEVTDVGSVIGEIKEMVILKVKRFEEGRR